MIPSSPRPLLCLVLSAFAVVSLPAVELNGAGATFPAPLYQRWFQEYNAAHPDVKVNYQAIGSGAGIKQFTEGTVDFGASDAAMNDVQIAQAPRGVALLPMTAGAIVLAYNLPDVPSLRLSRAAYAGIFLGTVTKWNDALIAGDNPGARLPDLPIAVATRSDGSGTTFVFSKHLCAVSPEFKAKVGGEATQIAWPVGVGGKGNDGVAALVKQTPGAIGYVEYGYAAHNGLPAAVLQNKAGRFVAATAESGAATLAHVDLPASLRAWADDPTEPDDYPIATFTWLLVPRANLDPAKWAALKDVILYGLGEGQKFAPELGYIPLPPSVAEKARAVLNAIP